jgi:uncharacterized protein
LAHEPSQDNRVTLIYNVAMLAVDVLAVWLMRRRKSLSAWFGIMTGAGVAAIALAGILGGCFEDHFGVIRLCSYGVFLHAEILLLATAFLWQSARPKLAIGMVLGFVVVLLIAVDAFLVEPTWLEVTHYSMTSPKIQKPVRIVVIADLQTDRIGEYEIDALRRAVDEKPDILLFAGDYIQAEGDAEKMWDQLHVILDELKICAHAKGFAIMGNTGPGANGMIKIFKGTGVEFDWRNSRSYDLPEMRLTCLSLYDSFNTRLEVANPTPDRFHLVMGHSPNFALGKIDADLLVAGHTHGGQVRIPVIGPLITHSRIPLSWSAGWTELPSGAKLLVSRGIGMERGYAPRMRFHCRPELSVIDLKPDE